MNAHRIIQSVYLVVVSIIVLKIIHLQLITDRYELNASSTSIKKEYEIPLRGMILDRNGKLLVANTPTYELTYIGELMDDKFDTLSFCKLIRMDKGKFKKKLDSILSLKNYNKTIPQTFIKSISREDYARINERLFRFPPFSLIQRPERNYLVETAGNIFGYINEVNAAYIKKDSTYYMPGDLAGMSGVEKSYEKELRGVKGIRYIQKDRLLRNIGSYKNGMLDVKAISGKELMLTIDYDLQLLAEELLQNKRGAVVALDPNNGEILALASSPVINPKLLSGPNKLKNLKALLNDTINKPMYDRAIQAAYPPGSTFKMINALAALQMGVIDSTYRHTCHHGYRLGSHKINCHCGTGYPIEIKTAITRSCNSYFSDVYKRIVQKYPDDPAKSLDEWNEIMQSFGLGVYMNNDLSSGNKGLMPNSAYYNRFYNNKWNAYTTIFNGIGQGQILVTPLQMANNAAIIANRGFFYTPHIVKKINGQPNDNPSFTERRETMVDRKYFEEIFQGMVGVVQSGTGRGIKTNSFTQAGKTGTSEVPPWRDHSIFILIAPVDKPKIVVSCLVENGGFGATIAAPIASLIAERYLLKKIERDYLVNRIKSISLQHEYQKQWVHHLKKIGKYMPPPELNAKKDSTKKKTYQQNNLNR